MLRLFLSHFVLLSWHFRAIYLVLLMLILLGALAIAWFESLPIGEALYFSFITGLTVGYGDIVPHTAAGRFVAVLLGFIGILFTGVVVAVTVRAVREAWDELHKRD